MRPDYGGKPVSVGVSLYVLSVSEISEKFMDYTFDMYFRWVICLDLIDRFVGIWQILEFGKFVLLNLFESWTS